MKRMNQFLKTCTQNLRKLDYGTMTDKVIFFNMYIYYYVYKGVIRSVNQPLFVYVLAF